MEETDNNPTNDFNIFAPWRWWGTWGWPMRIASIIAVVLSTLLAVDFATGFYRVALSR